MIEVLKPLYSIEILNFDEAAASSIEFSWGIMEQAALDKARGYYEFIIASTPNFGNTRADVQGVLDRPVNMMIKQIRKNGEFKRFSEALSSLPLGSFDRHVGAGILADIIGEGERDIPWEIAQRENHIDNRKISNEGVEIACQMIKNGAQSPDPEIQLKTDEAINYFLFQQKFRASRALEGEIPEKLKQTIKEFYPDSKW
jgi:hypothetical protein